MAVAVVAAAEAAATMAVFKKKTHEISTIRDFNGERRNGERMFAIECGKKKHTLHLLLLLNQ